MKIHTTNENTYQGKKEYWTEEKTGSFVLEQDLVLVHKSHTKIKAFEVGVVSCAYDEYQSERFIQSYDYQYIIDNFKVSKNLTSIVRNDIDPEYVYTMIVPKGTPVEEFGNEYRFNMNHSIKIELIGTMGRLIIIDDSYNTSVYGQNTINVFTSRL